MTLQGKYWREASSLILAAPNTDVVGRAKSLDLNQVQPDYRVLMVKRSSRSDFAPDVWVFPGGIVDHQDFNEEWTEVFEKVTRRPLKEIAKSLVITPSREDIFVVNRGTSIPAEVAFRITAIRETFEESGVLLVKSAAEFPSFPDGAQNSCRPATMHGSSSRKWRQKIREDAAVFRDLCRHLGVIPDIWALRSWSNWLTPPTQQLEKPPVKPRRYDTMFFTCCVDEMPKAEADGQETSTSLWTTPIEMLQRFHRKDGVVLMGTQHYELTRLRGYSSLHVLSTFTAQRQAAGVKRWMPCYYACSDGLINTLPGDDLYPQDPNYEGYKILELTKSIEASQQESNNLNRIERRAVNGETVNTLYCNISENGHPVPPPDLTRITRSSL